MFIKSNLLIIILFSNFSDKHIVGLNPLHRIEHKVRDGMSHSLKVCTNWQVWVLVTSLNDSVPMSTESFLCTLSTLLWPIRAGPVTLGAGANVQEVAGSTGNTAPDRQLFSCAADCHRLQHLARVKVGVEA